MRLLAVRSWPKFNVLNMTPTSLTTHSFVDFAADTARQAAARPKLNDYCLTCIWWARIWGRAVRVQPFHPNFSQKLSYNRFIWPQITLQKYQICARVIGGIVR